MKKIKVFILDVQISNSSECYVREQGFTTFDKAFKFLLAKYQENEDTEDKLFIEELRNSIKEITIID
jgi:hypothetical protein